MCGCFHTALYIFSLPTKEINTTNCGHTKLTNTICSCQLLIPNMKFAMAQLCNISKTSLTKFKDCIIGHSGPAHVEAVHISHNLCLSGVFFKHLCLWPLSRSDMQVLISWCIYHSESNTMIEIIFELIRNIGEE